MSGLCCEDEYKPRVHTGFYNNFLATAPLIKKYIDPLLAPDQPPRKLFVVGHSLGAGVASIATCYFLLHHDWTQLPHKLVCVTAGSPRSVQGSMRDLIQEQMQKLRPLDKAVICRVVRDKDVVTTLPPAVFGFAHLEKVVYITKSGEVLINPVFDESHMITDKELKKLDLYDDDDDEDATEGNAPESEARDVKETKEAEPVKSKYERKVNRIPRVFRDHMPDFYLKPLMALQEKEHPMEKPIVEKVEEFHADVKQAEVKQADVTQIDVSTKKRFQFFRRRTKASQIAQHE
jgi:pimeloyl-ACP methyl ester carboxylesterase